MNPYKQKTKQIGILKMDVFDLNTSGNPYLRRMVTQAELLIYGISTAMLHMFYMGHHSKLW